MSVQLRALMALGALAVVAACAPRAEPIVFEPAPAITSPAPIGSKFGK